ncbi:transposase zinc-binding domain-containing protein [Aeromonas caviae]|uniref:transposase zinc-binding domain-containing protein n=1 Tax=Aeromonas caviae TaxID=648 RepID=UPI002868CBCA|nr:transposase zinc-binding domain-containing protein [Aeromonas caviae]WMX34190.1 transposase zinc-binding domain-containing protein [Aeromonas caviae]
MSLARNATASQSPTQTNGYERHQPDQTLLYQLVEQHYPAFKASLEAQGQHLPRYIQQEFNDLLQCGRLEYGFMRVRCEDCHHERLVHIPVENEHLFRFKMNADSGLRVHRFRTPQSTNSDVR